MDILHYHTKVNAITGEVLSSKEWIESSKQIVPFRRTSKFVKSFKSDVPKFSNDTYYKYWYLLAGQLEQNTNRIVKVVESDNKLTKVVPMTADDIRDFLGISKSTYYRFMSHCKKKHYIHRATMNNEQAFFINPVYELNGSGITTELYLVFQGTQVEKYISESTKELIKQYLGA